MKGQIGKLMKQAQQMQANMQKLSRSWPTWRWRASREAGWWKVIMTGRHELRRVSIDPSLFVDDDREMLEDLVAAAVNDAVQRVEKNTQEKMSGFASGFELPAGFKMPF